MNKRLIDLMKRNSVILARRAKPAKQQPSPEPLVDNIVSKCLQDLVSESRSAIVLENELLGTLTKSPSTITFPRFTTVVTCLKTNGKEAFFDIVHDNNTSIYLSKKKTKTEATFVKINNMTKYGPLTMLGVNIRTYNSGQLIVDDLGFTVGDRFGVTFQVPTRGTLPDVRVLFSLASYCFSDVTRWKPLARSLLSFKSGRYVPPTITDPRLRRIGIDQALTYVQGGPGVGKTWELCKRAEAAFREKILTVIVGITNNNIIDIASRLARMKIPHNIVLSGEARKTYKFTEYSNNLTDSAYWELFGDSKNLKDSSVTFSPLFIMTSNKGLSPKYQERLIYFDLTLVDEISLMTVREFLALVSMNPAAIVLYGDHLQGFPFFSSLVPINKSTIVSPVTALELVGSPFHLQINGKFRMPESYSRFFSDFFYCNRAHYKVSSITNISSFVKVLFDNSDFLKLGKYRNKIDSKEIDAPKNKKKNKGKGTLIGGFNYDGSTNYNDFYKGYEKLLSKVKIKADQKQLDFMSAFKPAVKTSRHNLLLIYYLMTVFDAKTDAHVTTYIAQNEFALSMGLNSKTVRPIQGDESERVFVDYVTPVVTPFVTNSSQIVALSRFKTTLVFLSIPDVIVNKRRWKFVFDRDKTIWDNYQSFCSSVNSLKDPLVSIDHNGDHSLKWFFFLKVVELALSMVNQLPYALQTFSPSDNFALDWDDNDDEYYDQNDHEPWDKIDCRD